MTHPFLYPIEKNLKVLDGTKKCNGHNSEEIFNLIKKRDKRKPMALVAKTIKGYPVSFMKNVPMWHYKSPSKEEYKKAKKELMNK